VCLKVGTKPPIYNLTHEFLINMAFTMAYPNFKKSLKMAFGPLGVNNEELLLGISRLLFARGLAISIIPNLYRFLY
jgi:NurA-like 5'-3' nuclease